MYAKKAVQSPFLGLRMLWPLGMMPLMPPVVPAAEDPPPSPKAWVPVNMDWINNLNKDNLLERSKEAT